jgi:hypothetical protein
MSGNPGNVVVFATVDSSSGSGANAGGDAPSPVAVLTNTGDISLTGTFLARGGNSAVQPGKGSIGAGIQSGIAGTAGNIFFSGTIDLSGGSSSAAASADCPGGDGGQLQFDTNAPTSSVVIAPGSLIKLDGGDSTGTRKGGNGGRLDVRTNDQKISLGGTFLIRGGQATGAGGGGGDGGGAVIASDLDSNGVAGDITLEVGAVIDVSAGGGSGASPAGGSVQFIADNNSNSLTNGIVQNLGLIVARGGSPNGNGGDVTFNGLNADGVTVGPAPGVQDRSGTGTGVAGTFTAL